MAPQPAPPKPRIPPALVGAGVLVVVIGFGLPRLVSGDALAPAAPADPGLTWGLVKLVGCFAAVCGGCVLVVRLAATATPPKPGATRVLATLPLDGRCTVQLVKAGDRRLLVGIDAGGVKALLELPGPPPDAPPPTDPVVVGPVRLEAPPAEPPLVDQITAVIARLTAARNDSGTEGHGDGETR